MIPVRTLLMRRVNLAGSRADEYGPGTNTAKSLTSAEDSHGGWSLAKAADFGPNLIASDLSAEPRPPPSHRPLQPRHALDVGRVREHVEGLDFGKGVTARGEVARVPSEGGGVARH